MNPIDVLSSEVRLSPEDKQTCWHCPSPAVAIWPTCSDSPRPYCQFHLDKSKERLTIALGGQGELHMLWPTNRA